MMSSYPRCRCPACNKAFRVELKRPTSLSPTLGLIACPQCGLKFHRFDSHYLNASPRSVPPRSFSNFG
jgi:hypothetical protein